MVINSFKYLILLILLTQSCNFKFEKEKWRESAEYCEKAIQIGRDNGEWRAVGEVQSLHKRAKKKALEDELAKNRLKMADVSEYIDYLEEQYEAKGGNSIALNKGPKSWSFFRSLFRAHFYVLLNQE